MDDKIPEKTKRKAFTVSLESSKVLKFLKEKDYRAYTITNV